MCGIAGLIQLNETSPVLSSRDKILETLRLMSDEIKHRGPDDSGFWLSEDLDVGFSHRRLSIVDLSSNAHQPMFSSDSRFVITFNGEIYNHKELRNSLEKEGIIFKTNSDTEVLIECYRKYSEDCLNHFDGMFAFVIYDRLKKEIFAARDAFGEKPFYYTWINSCFYFSSELSSLKKVPGFNTEVDQNTIARFLCLQYVDNNFGFYKNTYKLKPGHYIKLSKNKFVINRYFEFLPDECTKSHKNEHELIDELEEILLKSIKRRLDADVPIGAFLSSGLDSSLVAAMAQKKFNANLMTFTIGFDNWQDSEHIEASKLAHVLGTRHKEQLLSPDCYHISDEIIKRIDEPNADTSLLPTYLLSRLARKSVKVVLSGDGADELFGGYGRYFSLLSEDSSHNKEYNPGKSYYSNKILPFTETELSDFLTSIPESTIDFLSELRSSINQSNLSLINRLRKTDAENYLPGAVLAKVDKMSMLNSLEVRTPFLSIEMARFAEKLPDRLIATPTEGKIILKKLAQRYLPSKYIRKEKKGFGVPFTSWGEQAIIKKAESNLTIDNGLNAWWFKAESFKHWLDNSKKNQAIEVYKIWGLYHLQQYLVNNKVSPVIISDPIQLWLLEDRIYQSKMENCIFSIYPLDLKINNKNGKTTVTSIWEKGNNHLSYNPNKDWLKNFDLILKKVYPDLKNRKVQIFFVGINNYFYFKFNKQLNTYNIKSCWYYEDNDWVKYSITNSSSKHQKNKGRPGPFIYSHIENKIIPYSKKQLLDDFNFYINCTFKKDTLINKVDPFSHEECRYFFDKQTPQRAISLIEESYYALKTFFNEKYFFKWAQSTIKTGFTRKGIEKNTLLFILPSLISGGAERQACNLMLSLKKSGLQVKLLTLSPLIGSNKHYKYLLEDSGVSILNLKENINYPDYHLLKNTLPESYIKLIKNPNPVMRKQVLPVFYRIFHENPSHVICFLDIANLLGGLASILAGVPNIITSFRNINPTSFSFYENWYFNFYQIILQSPNITLTGNSNLGNKSYAQWLSIEESRIKILRNGVDFSHYDDVRKHSINAIKGSFNITNKDKILGGIFRLSEEKRPELFIDTFLEVRNKFPSIKAFIIGEGPLRSTLEAKIKQNNITDCFFLVGTVQDVNAYIQSATLFLQTSRTEGTANSLLEAQYLKKPVVATDGGGVSESLKDGFTGFLLDTSDPVIIARKILEIIDNESLLKEMGEHAHRFVQEEFSLTKSTNKLLELCQLNDFRID